MNIGTVVEGPTDRLVLKAILDRLCPGQHRYLDLQPSLTLGEIGTGWKGVRRWCRETWQREGSSLDQILSANTGPQLDLLVIQVDAEIAAEHDLQEDDNTPIARVQHPCPPIQPTIGQLKQIIKRWLGRDNLPPQVILAIPAQNIENWTFAALFPDDELCTQDDYECIKHRHHRPDYRLTLREYGKLFERTSGGRVNKSERRYRKLLPQVVAGWPTVCGICFQAQQFNQDVLGRLPPTPPPTPAPDQL